MLTRRQFCQAGLIGLSSPLVVRRVYARRQAAELELSTLRPGVHNISGSGGNVLALESPAGLVLVDAKLANAGPALRDLVVDQFGSEPAMLINTHHHADHTGGNFAFQSSSKILAHKNVQPRLKANVDERWRPELARLAKSLRDAGDIKQADTLDATVAQLSVNDFAADTQLDPGSVPTTLSMPNCTIAFHHRGNGHTDNDLIVQFTDHDIIHMGDLLFHDLHPFIDRPAGANTKQWIKRLDEAYELCTDKTIVVPGHGEVTDRTALTSMKVYFEQLRDIVQAAIDSGASRAEVGALKPDVFKDRGFAQLQQRCLEAMYDELTGAPAA